MNFDFTSEQTQLADTVRRLIEKDYGFDVRNRIVRSDSGTSDEIWAKLVDLGLTALPIPEAQGGFDGKAVDLLLVMQELGRGLVAEPYFATILAAQFLKHSTSADHLALLEAVAGGSAKLAAALGEHDSRHDLTRVAMKAESAGDGYTLSGRKSVVLFGAQADRLIVSARLPARTSTRASAGDDGLALFVVDANAEGIVRKDLRTLDGQRVAEIFFDGVAVAAGDLIARGDAAVRSARRGERR